MAELEDMERALKEVGEKVGRLVEENARLRRERAERTAKLAELQKKIEDKNIIINKLEQEKGIINQGNAQTGGEGTAEMKRRIDQLIKEIEKSLAILAKVD